MPQDLHCRTKVDEDFVENSYKISFRWTTQKHQHVFLKL